MKNAKAVEEATRALASGEFEAHREKLTEPLLASFWEGWRKANLEYKLGLNAGKVTGDYAADMMTEKLLGQIESLYQGAARETAQEMQDFLISGGGMEDFEKKLAEKIKAKLAGESITLPSGYKTTVDHYVRTVTQTAVRQARDLGMKTAAADSGIIDTNECIAVSALLPTTCKYCRARHGQKIKWDESILLHPNCVFRGRTPVYTDKGWKRINKIKEGDYVLTCKGRFRKVLQVHKNKVNKKPYVLLKIPLTSSTNIQLKLTIEHPLLVSGNWVEAGKIKVGDKVQILAKKCANPKCANPVRMTSNSFRQVKYCSNHCSSQEVVTNLWKTKKWRDNVTSKSRNRMNRLYKEGKIDTKAITKNAHKKMHEMVANGTWVLSNPEVHLKSNRKLGSLRNGGTYLEKKIRWLLSQKGLEFEGQYPIPKGVDTLNRPRHYFVDFAIPDKKIAFECDGVYWHNKEKDSEREESIKGHGWHVVRFSEDDIRNNLRSCSETIDRVLMNHNGEYMFMDAEIASVELGISSYNATLYNLSVEEDESYILHGVVSHNCACSRQMVIKKDLGIPQVYKDSDFKAQPDADWQKLQNLANMLLQ